MLALMVAGVALTVSACEHGTPTGVQPPVAAHADRAGDASNVNAYGLAYPSKSDPYVCFTSTALGAGVYRYGRVSLHFPQPAQSPTGATHRYLFGGKNASGQIVFIASCVIPATRTAVDWMNRRLRVVDPAGNPVAVGRNMPRTDGPSTMGCVSDGECALDPITVTVAPMPVDNCNVEGCTTEGGGMGTVDIGGGGGTTTGTTADPGSPMPDDSVEVDAGSCPSILSGKVITALISVGGSNHQFDFEGPMYKLPNTDPARYAVKSTVSKDGQWIATEGWIEVNCFGAYTPAIFGRRAWVGEAWYAGKSDLHMIYGPQHTSF